MTPDPLPPGRRIAPSILSADYARLGAALEEVLDAGARVVHVDVMDGHFVPPITIGPLVVDAIRERVHAVGGALDVHLMVERPERQVADFARAGADEITVHQEATPHLHRVLESIREHGVLAGVAINPATPVETLVDIAPHADLALCMTVNPGWGGQSFISASTAKVERLRRLAPAEVRLGVDGGIDVATAPGCARAGADLFVAGSAVFGSEDPGGAYQALAEAVAAA